MIVPLKTQEILDEEIIPLLTILLYQASIDKHKIIQDYKGLHKRTLGSAVHDNLYYYVSVLSINGKLPQELIPFEWKHNITSLLYLNKKVTPIVITLNKQQKEDNKILKNENLKELTEDLSVEQMFFNVDHMRNDMKIPSIEDIKPMLIDQLIKRLQELPPRYLVQPIQFFNLGHEIDSNNNIKAGLLTSYTDKSFSRIFYLNETIDSISRTGNFSDSRRKKNVELDDDTEEQTDKQEGKNSFDE